MVVEQGEVWWADLGDPIGSEPGYRRPVVKCQVERGPLSMPINTRSIRRERHYIRLFFLLFLCRNHADIIRSMWRTLNAFVRYEEMSPRNASTVQRGVASKGLTTRINPDTVRKRRRFMG
jgi:hypothetical protein